jgi:hypothetical protein
MNKKLKEKVGGYGTFLCLGFFIWVLIVNNKEEKWAKKISAGERISEAKVSSVPISRSNLETKHGQSASVPDIAVSGSGRDFEFTPFSTYGKEIFGSMVLTWSNAGRSAKIEARSAKSTSQREEVRHYGNNCLIGVILRNVKKGEIYEIEIEGDRFLKKSAITIRIDEDENYVTAGPATSFDFVKLQELRQTTPFNVTFLVSKGGGRKLIKSEVWQAHQINDCPIALNRLSVSPDGTVSSRMLPWPTTFSGYVNENHPWIDVILREALDAGTANSFVGYGDDETETITQISSIWTALANRRIAYSNISTTTNSSLHRFQHVRFLDQTIDSKQANCIDGSVLLASLLRKIGLNVGIITVPGHAYVSIYDKTDKKRWFAIETTMMSTSSLEDAIKSATFDSEYALSKISDQLGKEGEEAYTEIRISKYREYGVLPIPYSGERSLVPILTGRLKKSKASASNASSTGSPVSGASDSTNRYFYAQDDIEMQRYLNSAGIKTAAQSDAELRDAADWIYNEAHKYDHLPPREAAWMRRKDLAKSWVNKIAILKARLKEDPYALEKYIYWKQVVAEINSARISFNSVKTPALIASEINKLPDGQKREVTEAFLSSVRILRDLDPYDGRDPAVIKSPEFPSVLERADSICNALAVIAYLPLDF